MRPERVTPDPQGSGIARAQALELAVMNDLRHYDRRDCRVFDCADPARPVHPSLDEQGFAIVDLSKKTALQEHLARVRAAGRASDEDAGASKEIASIRWEALPPPTPPEGLSVGTGECDSAEEDGAGCLAYMAVESNAPTTAQRSC